MAIDLNGIKISQLNPGVEKAASLTNETREGKQTRSSADGQQARLERDAEQVKLSRNANAIERLQDEIRAVDSFDSQRVEEISRAISEGRYPVDSQRIAQKFLELENQLY